MEDAEEALLNGNPHALITHIKDIEEIEDFRFLVDLCLKLQDFAALWFIMEVGSRYDEELDSYLFGRCGTSGQTLPCDFLQKRNNSIDTLKIAVLHGDEDLLFYALDILYSPLDPTTLEGYSSRDYKRMLNRSQDLDRIIEKILLQGSPSFLKSVFPFLTLHLRRRFPLSYKYDATHYKTQKRS